MRVIQVYNVLALLFAIISMVFIRGGSVGIDLYVVASVLIMLSQAMVIWLISRRKIYTRQIIIGIECFEMLVNAATAISSGEFEIIRYAVSCIPPIIVILYFAFSARAKAVLVQPWSDHSLREEQEAKSRTLWDPRSASFWMRLLIYFFAFSILGHWMEMGVQILVINGLFPGTVAAPDSLTWRDNMNPFFIYGIAVVFCGLVLYPVYLKLRERFPHQWQALLASFLFNTLFCVAAELILGFLFNADYSAWDYRDQFMNFEGQICLLYTLAFGVMASLISWFVYPMMENKFSNLNRDVFRVVFVVCCVLFIMIFVTYNIDLDTLMPGSGLSVDV